MGFLGDSVVRNPPANAGDMGSIPGSRKEWQPTPVFSHGKSHEQRRLAGYSPWGRKVTHTRVEIPRVKNHL